MRRFGLIGLVLLLAPSPPAAAAPPTLPFDEVRPGMRGTGRTVFSGSQIETFEVEILGKLPNVGPDQNLILARLTGGPLADTGVLAGMSGSPVTIDGKLVGAVAYSWGFAKQAIAGVTPIEEMLALAEVEHGDARPTGSAAPTLGELRGMGSPERLRAFLADLVARLFPHRTLPTSVPIAVSGIDPRGLSRIAPDFLRAGFMPVPGGSVDDADGPVEPLRPGSAMGLKLVRGDVDMTATGTVTWVDGDRVLALGHPLFGLGAVDLPLTAARVETVLPSMFQSARIARPLGEVGAVRQDRAVGLVGRLGARPRMIPVRLQLTDAAGGEHEFSFDIADDSLLSPLLLYISLNGVLASKERSFGNATVRLRAGSVIKMLGSDDVELDNLYAGPDAFDYGTGIAAYILYLLMNNTWSEPQVVGVNILVDYEEAPRLARIRRAALDRYRVAPGESVEVTVVLSPYRGPDLLLTREIFVPPETPPGPLSIAIGGALAVSRHEEFDGPLLPRDLDQLIWLINRLRRNDRIYILARRDDSGVLVGGDRMPNLPPSVARALTRPRSTGNVTSIPQRAVLEEVLPTDYAVEGHARIRLEVESR
jgi:hypothetical protein